MTERTTHSITTSLLALVFALFSTLALAQESRVYQLNNRTPDQRSWEKSTG